MVQILKVLQMVSRSGGMLRWNILQLLRCGYRYLDATTPTLSWRRAYRGSDTTSMASTEIFTVRSRLQGLVVEVLSPITSYDPYPFRTSRSNVEVRSDKPEIFDE